MAANQQSTSQRETPSLASITSPSPSAQSNLTRSLSEANSGSRNTVTHTNHAACSPPSSQPVNPRNIKAILSTNVYDYSLNRLAAYGPLLGTGIFITDGPAWSQSRALPRPTFAKSQIADLATFEALITELLVLLPTDGRPIDLQELFFGYAIDSATAFLLGRCSHTLRRLGFPAAAAASHHDVDFASAFEDAQAAIRTRERWGVLRMSHRDKHADECFQICHGFVEKAIDDALGSVRVPRASTTPTACGKETGHNHHSSTHCSSKRATAPFSATS
ncbi:hypothetical protein BO86DRAFT_384441 [Aspergillus japonicus CBS 114.51]|uniref:Cytochrome P450 n=1 Tax=Aspergillus japonicus CBS 114.51 TaxID=1448312 RepID=A0A8T8XHJ0_ASPJA|nr:hypothetical protein BO86DRAFT_384441 [Aspergillus japonicus CBS 114.51]RAH87244.1 hypothetical protein BO86DRAFT_384441 [Aspergillus japonicus CBS 114.51]